MSKYLLFVVLFILVTVTLGYCDKPYLVCDPALNVTDYQVVDNSGTPVTSIPTADGSLNYDLSVIVDGQHTINVKACNLWGCSESTEISFVKAVPGKSQNIKIVVVK